MNSRDLPAIVEASRRPSPLATPQALAWHAGTLWLSSRDERRLCGVDPATWTVSSAPVATPGIVWAGVAAFGALYLTVGEGDQDDRYLRRYRPGSGFDPDYRVAQPDFTGSYLGFDGASLYLSQWYQHRILQLDPENGKVISTVPIGAEISGHTFADGALYVLRGTEQDGEDWHVARIAGLIENAPVVQPLARVPFACRSLTYDGEQFWTNHRAANETVSFTLPA